MRALQRTSGEANISMFEGVVPNHQSLQSVAISCKREWTAKPVRMFYCGTEFLDCRMTRKSIPEWHARWFELSRRLASTQVLAFIPRLVMQASTYRGDLASPTIVDEKCSTQDSRSLLAIHNVVLTVVSPIQ